MEERKNDTLAGSTEEPRSSYLRVSAAPGRKRVHILIVDDQPAMRKTLRKLFEREVGWEVCGEAQNGREAIKSALQLKPDLITLDLSMPVMNGMDAARELRRVLPSVPLVMVTLYNTPHLEEEAQRVGVDAVIEKSAPGALIACLSRLLESHD
jgi:DNA-binding NarL/FixJ family response regulator